ncbi:MAG: ParB/RepB/Spo0J family partition protein [Paludibacteraceae bacterium]|nr:ParB/RepB/Spo0J family partition protein [Paludibacteraceae bacterium]
MASNNNKQKLGRGLDSLLGANSTSNTKPAEAVGSTVFAELPISDVHPNPNQPRTDFDEQALNELADSIRENGIITPITVRKIADHNYQIIAGERRYRAAQIASLTKIPAYIREVNEDKVLELALIENIQREDLNAIEIALSYNNLAQSFSLTQEQIAERVGKKRSTIANYLRLLNLPAEIQLGLKDGKIEMGHARALASVESTERQLEIYNKVLAENASVRRTEQLCSSDAKTKPTKPSSIHINEVADIEDGLNMILGSKVKLAYSEKGSGKITISFKSDDEFERLMKLFEQLKDTPNDTL